MAYGAFRGAEYRCSNTRVPTQILFSNTRFSTVGPQIFPIQMSVTVRRCSTKQKIRKFHKKCRDLYLGNSQLRYTKFHVFSQSFQAQCVFPDIRDYFHFSVLPVQWDPWKTGRFEAKIRMTDAELGARHLGM